MAPILPEPWAMRRRGGGASLLVVGDKVDDGREVVEKQCLPQLRLLQLLPELRGGGQLRCLVLGPQQRRREVAVERFVGDEVLGPQRHPEAVGVVVNGRRCVGCGGRDGGGGAALPELQLARTRRRGRRRRGGGAPLRVLRSASAAHFLAALRSQPVEEGEVPARRDAAGHVPVAAPEFCGFGDFAGSARDALSPAPCRSLLSYAPSPPIHPSPSPPWSSAAKDRKELESVLQPAGLGR